MFLGKGILKIYSKFTGEHPCRSAISIKLLYWNLTSTLIFCFVFNGAREFKICRQESWKPFRLLPFGSLDKIPPKTEDYGNFCTFDKRLKVH